MTLGEKLWRLREEKGMSQDELAEKLDVSRQTISNWERDKALPDAEKLKRLCEALGICADDLLFSEVLPKESAPDSPKRSKEEEPLEKTEPPKEPINRKGRGTVLLVIFSLSALLLFVGGLIGFLTARGSGEPPTVSSQFTLTDAGVSAFFMVLAFFVLAAGVAFYWKHRK